MDRINFLEENHTFVGNFIIKAITASEKIDEIHANKPEDGLVEIILTVNGIEVPFVETVRGMAHYMDEHILKKAEEIVEEKAEAVYDRFEALLSDVDDKIREEFAVLKAAS